MGLDNLALALSSAAFASKCDEYRHEARRCRQIVKAIMEHSSVNGVAVEFYVEKRRIDHASDPCFGLVFCAPGLDERNFVEPAKEILDWYLDRLGMPRGSLVTGKARIAGTDGDQ